MWQLLRNNYDGLNDVRNVGDIYTLLKDSFKDMMQEMLEAEMDVSLG